MDMDEKKTRASQWFTALRDQITAAFEAIEDELPASAQLGDRPAGRFVAHALAAHRP